MVKVTGAKGVLLGVVIGAFCLVNGMLFLSLYKEKSIKQQYVSMFPNFSLPSLMGSGALDKDDLSGRVVLVNIFGSWCVSCLGEHPLLMELKDQSIEIYGVNWRDQKRQALDWLTRHGNPYRDVMVDKEGDLVIKLGVSGAPETFVLGPDGRILYHWAGPLTSDIVEQYINPIVKRYENP